MRFVCKNAIVIVDMGCYKLKLIFLSGTCLLILPKYMENLEYSGQKKLRKLILACTNFIGPLLVF